MVLVFVFLMLLMLFNFPGMLLEVPLFFRVLWEFGFLVILGVLFVWRDLLDILNLGVRFH